MWNLTEGHWAAGSWHEFFFLRLVCSISQWQQYTKSQTWRGYTVNQRLAYYWHFWETCHTALAQDWIRAWLLQRPGYCWRKGLNKTICEAHAMHFLFTPSSPTHTDHRHSRWTQNLLASVYKGGQDPTHDKWSIVLILNVLEVQTTTCCKDIWLHNFRTWKLPSQKSIWDHCLHRLWTWSSFSAVIPVRQWSHILFLTGAVSCSEIVQSDVLQQVVVWTLKHIEYQNNRPFVMGRILSTLVTLQEDFWVHLECLWSVCCGRTWWKRKMHGIELHNIVCWGLFFSSSQASAAVMLWSNLEQGQVWHVSQKCNNMQPLIHVYPLHVDSLGVLLPLRYWARPASRKKIHVMRPSSPVPSVRVPHPYFYFVLDSNHDGQEI